MSRSSRAARAAAEARQGSLALVQPEPAPALRAPPDKHLPSIGVTVARSLEAGERVRIHFWRDHAERTLSLSLTTEGLVLERRLLAIRRAEGELRIAWRDVYYLEAEGAEASHYVDPARLYDLPLALARALYAGTEARCRDTYEVRESLRRALERPHLFSRVAYTLPSWQSPARAASTARKLAQWPDADLPHALPARGPWCADYGASRHDPSDATYRDLLAQLGLEMGEGGRMRASAPAPAHNLWQGPLRPEGPGAGPLDYWKARLLELGTAPTYLNGVPVRRLPCSPVRFEVCRFELTAEAGLGGGAGQRIGHAQATLHEAAELVQRGLCPHYRYSARADRWHEAGG